MGNYMYAKQDQEQHDHEQQQHENDQQQNDQTGQEEHLDHQETPTSGKGTLLTI